MTVWHRAFVVGGILAAMLAVCTVSAHAQHRITGTVVDVQSEKPIPQANVFLEATRRGTATDNQGRFELRDVETGTYTLIVSMVGYERKERTVTVKPERSGAATVDVRVELTSEVQELEGVTVEGSREEWLERLDRFRDSFFGDTPNSDACEFVNPEVLSFEEDEEKLIAYSQRPLRVRNEALGYRITFHLSKYVVRPEAWTRYGTAEFDTLAADSRQQRAEWRKARAETYRGSLYHFLDVLRAGTLEGSNFQVRIASPHQLRVQGEEIRVGGGKVISEARKLFMLSDRPNWGYLTVLPIRGANAGLLVQYSSSEQFATAEFASASTESAEPSGGRFPDPESDQKVTWIRIPGGSRVLIDTETGRYVRPDGGYVMEGYWGTYMTAATALPAGYQPPDVAE